MVSIIVIDQMNTQQQDKSKGYIAHYQQNLNLSPSSGELSSSHSYQQVQSSAHSFFDKFKLPDYKLSSAFRLCQPLTQTNQSSGLKRPAIIRKHRGNYRKYTVAQKEQAVKQIFQGVDAKEISQKYGIPRRNLLRWKKNGCERKQGGGRPTDGEMQLTLYTKIDGKIIQTEKEIRAEAKRLSKMTDFKASKGWYCKFSRRYNQWKKQQHQRSINTLGSSQGLEKEMFLLPEVSQDSESQQFSSKSSFLQKDDQ